MPDTRHVIVLGIDGLRPDMIDAETMPNLTALRERGVWSSEHRTVFPSETRGALSALATGSRPETTGILGNQFFARDGSGRQTGTDTIHDWRAGEARLTGGMVTATSLSETLAKAGRSLAVVTSSGQGSFTALNWQGETRGQVGFNVRHPQIAFPHDLAVNISTRHGVPANGFERGHEQHAVEIFTQSVWPARKPDATIIWLTEVDSASHRYGLGAKDQIASMRQCDAALGLLLDWRESQPERDAITIFVTSDHGHSTIGELVSVGEALTAAGIKAAKSFENGADVLYRAGRAPGFWLKRHDPGLLQGVFDALVAQNWYGAAFTRALEPGSSQGRIEGTLALELTGAGHRRAPDLYLELKGDRDRNAHGIWGTSMCDTGGYSTGLGGGTHGGMHAAEIAAVLVADGPGLKRGETIVSRTGIADIAPTLLAMLGVETPATMSGRVLKELMDGAEAAPPQIEEFTASAGGKTSRLRTARVGDHRYVDEATGTADGAADPQPTDRSDLRVGELQAG